MKTGSSDNTKFRAGLFVLVFAILGLGLLSTLRVSADDDVVIDPKSGQRVLVNQLAILGEGKDVRNIVAECGGTITIAVPETDTYQAKFPVRSLKQLDAVAKKLQQQGLKTQYVIVTKPSGSSGLM